MIKNTIILILILVKSAIGQSYNNQIRDSLIEDFLIWKINSSDSSEKIGRVSNKIVQYDEYDIKLLKSTKLSSIFSNKDIVFINHQLETYKKVKKWKSTKFNSNLINIDTLTDQSTLFWEFSIPIFNETMEYCYLVSNISCKEKYCHVNTVSIYRKMDLDKWKLLKELSHLTY